MTESRSTPAAGDETASLLERTAIAAQRVDLGLLSPKARREARSLLERSGADFDGRRLVDLCLEGRAGDGTAALRRALLGLRARLIGLEGRGGRRGRSIFVRLTATLTAKLIFFGIYTFLVLVLVYLAKRNWAVADVYGLGDRLLAFFRG